MTGALVSSRDLRRGLSLPVQPVVAVVVERVGPQLQEHGNGAHHTDYLRALHSIYVIGFLMFSRAELTGQDNYSLAEGCDLPRSGHSAECKSKDALCFGPVFLLFLMILKKQTKSART